MIRVKIRLLLLSLMIFSAGLSAQGFETPQQAIDAYITAVSTGSGEHVEMAYSKDATIKFYDREGRLREYTRDSFAKSVDGGGTWSAEIETTALFITENTAAATVEFTWGENAEHGYVDYLNLIRLNGHWRITNKVAQYISRQE